MVLDTAVTTCMMSLGTACAVPQLLGVNHGAST